jgi:hypothetical protein
VRIIVPLALQLGGVPEQRCLRLSIDGLGTSWLCGGSVRCRADGQPLPRQPIAKRAVLTKDEHQALVNDVVAARFEIPAVVFEILQNIAIEFDRDLIAFLFGCLGMTAAMLATPS